MKYDALVEPTPEGWSGCILGLPVAGVGDTIEETKQSLTDGAALYVEAMTEYNQPIPPPGPYLGPPLEPGGRILPKAIEVEIPVLSG